jgi:lauroyl/myristoyl acyltransferase
VTPSRRPDRLVSRHDLLGIATLSLVGLLERGLPPAAWRRACRIVARPLAMWRARHRPGLKLASAHTGLSAVAMQTGLFAGELESLLLMTRLRRVPSWQPDVACQGEGILAAALEQRRGVVLWVHRFQPFVHFIALARAGARMVRLSNPEHGHFARSRFGSQFLNRLQLEAEARYCERIVVTREDLASLRALARRLADNAVVVMYADGLGQRVLELPVPGGVATFGLGPPMLANHAQATLLPIFAVAEGQRGFRVVVEAPVPVDGTRSNVEAAVRSHGATFGRYLQAYPEQWRGWPSARASAA